MDVTLETVTRKAKLQESVNLHVAECIRKFKLPKQFPSTVSELRLSKGESENHVTTVQSKSFHNTLTSLPMSGKMKFIPNKEVSFSENLQKLKLKLPNGKDLGEVKILLPRQNEGLQKKFISISKVTKLTEKPVMWTVQQPNEKRNKPKIKTITKLFDSSSSLEHLTKLTESKIKQPLSDSITLDNKVEKSNQASQQKFKIDHNYVDMQKTINENSYSVVEKQDNLLQRITLKNLSDSNKVIRQRDDDQTLKSTPEKTLSLNSIMQSTVHNNVHKNNLEKEIVRSSLIDSLTKKRSNSFIEQYKNCENKKICLEIRAEESMSNGNMELGCERKTIKLQNSFKSGMGTITGKNIMVIVPNKDVEKLAMTKEKDIQKDKTKSVILPSEEIISEKASENRNFVNNVNDNFNNKRITCISNNEGNVLSVNGSDNEIKEINTENRKKQDLLDKFTILEKAVMSVQDASLREKALLALKDCGIKVKKSVPVKRALSTKVIKESQTQTEIFSLLKNQEFLHVSEEFADLLRIQVNRKINKQPINKLFANKPIAETNKEQCKIEFKCKLEKFLEKVFPNNKLVRDVKEAFLQNNVGQAKLIIKQMQTDLDAAKLFDNNGLLGIHKAVLNNNIQEVQRHILMLKATKQSIDVCSQDNKTSLELAVEYEVNPQIIKILLDAGAQPVSSKPVHDSAVLIAARESSKILPLLLRYINRNNRTLLNAKNSEGFAAIHYCAQRGNLKGITELLKHRVDVNLEEERSGRTALFYAVDTKNLDVNQDVYNEIAHKLLEHGAISNIPIFSKHSVLSLIEDVKNHSLKMALNKAVQF